MRLTRLEIFSGATDRTTGAHSTPRFFGRSGGNRRNNRREYAEKGGTLGGTESVLFRLFTPFYGFLRLTGNKIIRTASEVSGSVEELRPASLRPHPLTSCFPKETT